MKEQFIKMRRQLDAYSQIASEMTFVKNIGVSTDARDFHSDKKTFELVGFPEDTISKPIERCIENLLLAKAWTGKLLGHIGDSTPYKNDGKREDVKSIEPTDAVVDIKPWKEKNNWNAFNPVQKVDQLRQLVQNTLIDVQGFFPDAEYLKTVDNARSFNIARTEIESHLIEARFQLGFELQRMKEETDGIDYNTPLYGGVKQK